MSAGEGKVTSLVPRAREKLTSEQIEVLEALASGHKMIFSRDGDEAWLIPRHPTGFLSDAQTIDLRKAGLIHNVADEPDSDTDDYDRSWHAEITPAGRALLESKERQQ